MRRAPIKLIVHYPSTPEGRHALENQVARVHADFLLSRVKSLSCPSDQKLALIDSVIEKLDSGAGKGSSAGKGAESK